MRKIWKIDDKERVRENINSVDQANQGTDQANQGTDQANQGTDQANQGIDQPNFGSIKILAVCKKEKSCRFFLQP